MKLQLGGNKEWEDWLNLDATAPTPFHFVLDNKFLLKDNSQDIVYSSHLLEHLPINVVEYVLNECHRVLKPDGYLVIKIPDFDFVLANWRAKNHKFFDGWGLRKIIPTWKSQSIKDTINYRCSMIFCGFWNESYGDHFAGKRNINPPIAATLRKKALGMGNITFNHQTAWGKDEFMNLLRKHNFFVKRGLTKQDIVKEYSDIPDIKDKLDISLYVVSHKI
jgi:SAM-dependent methyltransferase